MYDSIIEYNSIIDAIIDAYEGDDIWTYEDEVRTAIDNCDDNDYNDDDENEENR